ncbi:SDR family NAD(P)-dependent oxidoreductase [Jiangella ureilytica]|uniref:SDR family NAD(P)-dependent oxidoreductase n=1 Tax=Jiangella ureilytica TaxID=2530374 RepID=UPI0013A5EAAE|nr:SDR family oxidoreductase [Jiangella ureilytica]
MSGLTDTGGRRRAARHADGSSVAGNGAGDFDGALSVIVGGNQGIGAAIGLALAAAGSRLVIIGRDEGRLAEAKKAAEEVGTDVVATQVADISSVDSIHAMVERVLADHGAPTILVNSAGGLVRKPAFDVTVEDWDWLMETHLRGTFFTCQGFGRAMAAEGYGKIINMSSTWASTFLPGRIVYATAKAGLGHMTEGLAVEWAPLGIRVNAIAPTTTTTPRVERAIEADANLQRTAVSKIPLGRLATPDDIVGAALYLASPVSDFVTGHTLYVDGGWRVSK